MHFTAGGTFMMIFILNHHLHFIFIFIFFFIFKVKMGKPVLLEGLTDVLVNGRESWQVRVVG